VRILVTGGAGFIGSHYVRTMLSGGYPGYEDAAVTVLDHLTYAGNLANLAPVSASPRLTFVQGDIADPALVRAGEEMEHRDALGVEAGLIGRAVAVAARDHFQMCRRR